MDIPHDRYFVRRKPAATPDFEERYWGMIVDPDGRVRDRLSEREQCLADISEELAFIRSLRPGRILDVGCGLGFLLSALSDEWERHGVEVSRFAAERAQLHGTIHVGDLVSAGYPSDYFDVIVVYHVIEHVEDPIGLIREVRRILKPEGRLVMATPDFDCALARRFGEKFRMLHDVTHISLFTCESMYRFLRDHDFEIQHVGHPYFQTRHFTRENLERLFDVSRISPPFYGNFMTFYCSRPAAAPSRTLSQLGDACRHYGVDFDRAVAKASVLIRSASATNAETVIVAEPGVQGAAIHAASLLRKVGMSVDVVDADVTLEDVGLVIAVLPTRGSDSVPTGILQRLDAGLPVVALTGRHPASALERCGALLAVAGDERTVERLHLFLLDFLCETVGDAGVSPPSHV